MKKIKKIIKITFGSLIASFFLFSLFIIITGIIALNKNEAPEIFGFSYSVVVSPSMEPVIMTGEMIITKDVNPNKLEVGNIILFKSKEGKTKGMQIIHRIVSISDDNIITTKGDNNPGIDSEEVTFDMIEGIYVTKIPFKNVGTFITKNKNIVFGVLIIIFLGIGIVEIVNIYKTIVNTKKEEMEAKVKEQALQELKRELLIEETKKLNNKKREEDNEKS